jgi:hypothetical protein
MTGTFTWKNRWEGTIENFGPSIGIDGGPTRSERLNGRFF